MKLSRVSEQPNSVSIFQDWRENKGNFKSRLVMVFYRLAFLIQGNRLLSILFFWYLLIYKFIIGWVLNIGISSKSIIGKGLRIQYGFGTVIGGQTVIGNSCNISQLTTIGNKIIENGTFSKSPIIGNNVDIGVNVTIIGDVRIGNNVVIGAGAVITKDIENNCVVVGNPAVLLKKKYDLTSSYDIE